MLFYIRQLFSVCILLHSLTAILAFFQYFPFDEFRWLKVWFFMSPEKSDFLFVLFSFFKPVSALLLLPSFARPFRPAQHCDASRRSQYILPLLPPRGLFKDWVGSVHCSVSMYIKLCLASCCVLYSTKQKSCELCDSCRRKVHHLIPASASSFCIYFAPMVIQL